MKAVGYVRITAEEEAKGFEDVKTQEARIRNYAKGEGLDIVTVYVDDPIGVLQSAPTLGDVCSRAGVINMLDEATAKDWGFVVVTEQARLVRGDIDFDPLAELTRYGKRVVQVGQKLNLKKEKKKARKKESSRQTLSVAERLLKGREAGARAGKHQSGPAPYGYMRDYSERSTKGVRLQIHPEEAAVVRTIFKEYLRRKSMKRLIEFLDSQGLRTRRKKQWSRAGVSWILKNETYLGRVHFGNIRAKGQHPAIISPIIFNKVQKLIRKNNKRGGKKGKGDAAETSAA